MPGCRLVGALAGPPRASPFPGRAPCFRVRGSARLALGFKSTGARARPDPPGCFVMTTGQYAGNCNYNSNKSAACEPPCKLYGVVTRSLCVRK